MMTWTSNAEWPKGTVYMPDGTENTSDKHYTEEEAKGVCRMLERDGFGGNGKIFPIRTWVVRRNL